MAYEHHTYPLLWPSDEQLELIDHLSEHVKAAGFKNMREFAAKVHIKESMLYNFQRWNVILKKSDFNKIARVLGWELVKVKEDSPHVKRTVKQYIEDMVYLKYGGDEIDSRVIDGRVYFRVSHVMAVMGYSLQTLTFFKRKVGTGKIKSLRTQSGQMAIFSPIDGIKHFAASITRKNTQEFIGWLEKEERKLLACQES